MSDNNLEMKATLVGQDQSMSATVLAAMNRIKQLEKQIKSSFAPNKLITEIVSPKVMKSLQGTGKEISGLTKKYKDMARETRDLGNMNTQSWIKITTDINKGVKAWSKATGQTKKIMADDLKEKIKYAQAYRSLFNAEHRDYEKALRSHHNATSSLEIAHMRQQQRLHRQHANSVMEQRRNLMRNLRRMGSAAGGGGGSILSNPAFYGLAAAGATVAAGRSSVRSAVDLDRAEMNARINMDQSIVNAREMRDNWALPKSVSMGQNPARLMQTAVEASKAGVPEAMAQGTAEMVTMLAKTFGIEVDQAMDGMGYAIAQEMGAGRLKDMGGVEKLGNTAAFLAAKTAARPDQMFSFLRTGMGAGALLGMNQESTLAFGASAIQAGAQGQQSARFLGNLGETLSNLKMEAKTIQQRGGHRSPKDQLFMGLPGQLGYGGYGDIEDKIRKNPNTAVFDLIKSFKKIEDPLKREQAMTTMFGSGFSRFLANMISSPEMIDRTMKLAKEAMEQKHGANFISESWGEFTKSLEYFIDKVKATWTVVKDEMGDVLKPFIEQFSGWVSDWYNAVKSGGIKERFKRVLEGLTEGFLGKPGSFRDLLDKALGKPGNVNGGNVDNFFKFARGFATGLREFAAGIKTVMSTLAKFFNGSDDAEAMGKLTAQIISFVAALTLMAPVLSVFSSIVGLVAALAGAVAVISAPELLAIIGAFGLASKVVGKPKAVKDQEALQDALKEAHEYNKGKPKSERLKAGEDPQKRTAEKWSWNGRGDNAIDPNIHPMSFRSELNDTLGKLNGNLVRASLLSTDLSSRSPSGGGGYGAGSAGGGFSHLSGIGTPDALINSTPGGVLPNFGVGSGGIIKRDNLPSFGGGQGGGGLSKSAFEKTFAGTAMAGKYDEVVSAAKAHGISPSLLAGVMAHETGKGRVLAGNNPGGIMDPATGMSRKMQFGGLDAGISKTAQTVAKNWNAAGQNLDGMGRRYAPVGAANDPSDLNAGWAGGVRKYMGEMGDGSGAGAAGVTPRLAEKMGVKGGANFMHGQYGGVGQNQQKIMLASGKKLTVNAAAAESFKGFFDELEGGGYNIKSIAGFDARQKESGGWSQHAYGNAVDVNPFGLGNGFSRQLQTNLPPNVSDMAAKYGLSWGGDWKGKKDAMHFEWMGKKPWLDKVPTPNDAVRNVPPAAIPDASLGGGGGGANRGNVAIHINGGSHDPESLATMVQRRVDESMNWRAHDSESEYT
jgi:D-alanyl-D-alanine carboxypeptidase